MKSISAIICSLLLLSSLEAHAVMTPMSTDELTRGSQLVVRGTVTRVESYWSEDGKAILSRAYVSVTDVIRGEDVPPEVVVEFEGGEVGDVGYRVSDAAEFREGEDTLLFLTDSPIPHTTRPSQPGGNARTTSQIKARGLVGKAQGKYSIDHSGIARKRGFSVLGEPGTIDNNIEVEKLIGKIKKASQ